MEPMTQKQRDFIADIEDTLDIKYDGEDSKWQARDWISAHIDEFKEVKKEEEIYWYGEMFSYKGDYPLY